MIKYEPKHLCNFCGKPATTLIVGIVGIDHGTTAEICPECAKAASDILPGSVGPVKHPASAEYEAIERTNKAKDFLAQQQQNSFNIFGASRSVTDSGQSHGGLTGGDPLEQL